MGDDTIVRRLIEILSAFYVEKRTVEEDLTCSLTNEFLQNIQIVLLAKQSVILHRWKNFLRVCGCEMLSSSERYLRYVLCACRFELKFNFNIFEKFVGVFALVIYLNVETLKRTGVNFCKLIPDIFMVFYSSELKKTFCKRGGFHQFAKYINNPNYIALKSSSKVSSFCDLAATVDVLPKDSAQQMERVSGEEKDLLKTITFQVEEDWSSLTLAQNILNSTKIALPLLPSDADLKIKMHDFTHEETSQLEDTKIALEPLDLKIKVHDCTHEEISELKDIKIALESLDNVLEACSNSDSETSDVIGQMEDKSLYEDKTMYDDIIEAVIRYNRSGSSGQEKTNNHLEKKAYGILEHFKGNIESFIQVLDNYD